MKQRLYLFDNLKFILMFLVVFGHILELTPGYTNTSDLYRVIYSFHMPVFIFISGYFAKFSPRKILTTYLWPYLLLQTGYLLFIYYYYDPLITPKTIQYTNPYWILWYFLAMIGMHLLIPLFDTDNKYLRLLALLVSSAVSLLCGYETSISVYFGMSKILVFLPFFMLGYYLRRPTGKYRWYTPRARWIICASFAVLAALAAVFIAKKDSITPQMMFGQYSYAVQNYNILYRGAIHAASLVWLVFLTTMPLLYKKIPVASFVGKYTFPIFVFHGIIQKLIGKFNLFSYFPGPPILWSVLITLSIVLLLGNPVADKVFRYCFTLEPLVQLIEKRKRKG